MFYFPDPAAPLGFASLPHAFSHLNTPTSLTILLAICGAVAIASAAWPPVHHPAPRRKR